MTEALAPAEVTRTSAPESGSSPRTSKLGNLSMSSTIRSADQLRIEAPEIYNQMLIGIGAGICQKIKHSQDRIKEILREEQRYISRR